MHTGENMLMSADMTIRHRQAVSARLEHKRLCEAAYSVLQTYKESVSDTVVLGRVLHR